MRNSFKYPLSLAAAFLLISLSVGPTFLPQIFSTVAVVLAEEETNEDDSSDNEDDLTYLINRAELQIASQTASDDAEALTAVPFVSLGRKIPDPPPDYRG